jgi:hypothetical protein
MEDSKMAIFATGNIARLYCTYADVEITFNAQVIVASGLMPADVRLRVNERDVPCILHAASMKRARVIAKLDEGLVDVLSNGRNLVALRLAFRPQGAPAPIAFFVFCRVESLGEQSTQKPSVRFLTLQFSQRPADAMIGIIGSLLEMNSNAVRRKDERIVITPESMKRIGLESRESCVAIDGMPRTCIVRDLSFGGANILVTGVHGAGKNAGKVLFKLAQCEMKEDAVLDGSIVRAEEVDGEGNVVALSIRFSSDPPLSYKQKINDYFASEGNAG